ncbi:MAG: hypothetical protein ACRC9R_00730, partial [Enterovibrio sp.]
MKNNPFTSWLTCRTLRSALASGLFLFMMQPAFADFSVQVWSRSNKPLIAPLTFSSSVQLQTVLEQTIDQILQKNNTRIAKQAHSSDAIFWSGARLFQAQNQTMLLDSVLHSISTLKEAKVKDAAMVQS